MKFLRKSSQKIRRTHFWWEFLWNFWEFLKIPNLKFVGNFLTSLTGMWSSGEIPAGAFRKKNPGNIFKLLEMLLRNLQKLKLQKFSPSRKLGKFMGDLQDFLEKFQYSKFCEHFWRNSLALKAPGKTFCFQSADTQALKNIKISGLHHDRWKELY